MNDVPMDDREIARRSHLRARLIVTVKVRPLEKPRPDKRLTSREFKRAILRQYAVEWLCLFIAAAGLALAIAGWKR